MNFIGCTGPVEPPGELHDAAVAAARARFATATDMYGFYERFRKKSLDEVIASFNDDVGSNGWVNARGWLLGVTRDALLASGLDCSAFISDDGMNLDRRIEIQGQRIVPYGEAARRGITAVIVFED